MMKRRELIAMLTALGMSKASAKSLSSPNPSMEALLEMAEFVELAMNALEAVRQGVDAAKRQAKLAAASKLTGIPLERVKITTWHPDTCGCVVEYAWDRSSKEDERVHHQFSINPCCPQHKHFDDVLAENRRKNEAVTLLTQANPGKTHADVAWEFDADRNLSVRLA